MRALKTNKLANNPAYPKILHQYNEWLVSDGKVNAKKFYEEVILPEIPDYHLQSWYKFIHRFKTKTKMVVAEVVDGGPNSIKKYAENNFQNNLLNNEQAVHAGIQCALNVGATALEQLIYNPETLSVKERIDLLFKAMKAQDSRVNTVAKVKKSNRENEKFEYALNEARYGD